MNWWKKTKQPEFLFGASTDIGVVRDENQDAYGHISGRGPSGLEEHLLVVADGMGGHANGREASQIAVAALEEVFLAGLDTSVGERLQRSFQTANDRILNRAREMNLHDRMGTTCTALAISGNLMQIAHVGDSRAYRIRANEVSRMTTDHTHVEELRAQGVLTDVQAQHHPHRNALTRAMGIEPELKVDLSNPIRIDPEEWILLCSDGLAEVSPEEIKDIVRSHPPQKACDVLIREANDRGGRDNVTVVIVHALP